MSHPGELQTPPGASEEVSEFELFVAAVEGATGRRGERQGRETVLLCPAHGDRNPSLHVRAAAEGQPLAICRSQGCSFRDICRTIGYQPHGDEDDLWTPRGPAVAVYAYRNEYGELLYEVCRTADKQFPARRPDATSGSGWRWNLDGVERVLYRLPEVMAAIEAEETIYVTEGEKDADALAELGLTATCNPGGAGKWQDAYSGVLHGMDVVVVCDADEAGRAHARQVVDSLRGHAATAEALAPLEGKDVFDHLAAGHTIEQLVPAQLPDPPAGDAKANQQHGSNKPTLADLLVELALDQIEPFSSPDAEAYAFVRLDGRRECWPLQSRGFTRWLRRLGWTSTKKAFTATTLGEAVAVLEGIALYEGPVQPVHVRVGEPTRTSTSTSATPPGGRWRSAPMAGRSSNARSRSDVQPVRSPFRYRSAAATFSATCGRS